MKVLLIVCSILFYLYSTVGEVQDVLRKPPHAAKKKKFYTAAIVEYAPVLVLNPPESPQDNIGRNVDEYLIQIRKAKKQGADIIVFPELGLISSRLPKTATGLEPYTTLMPDPKEEIVVPCASDDWADVLTRLSCAARRNQIYIVFNTPERVGDGENIVVYNTNIVFDRKGAIIAKYRKQHLFVEPGFSNSESQDYTVFKTDFGVTFGTFICFDIFYAEPGLKMLRENPKVTDIAYPTSWYIELPFVPAVPYQAGWARANGVNLLAANFLNPARGKGGSGIYLADGEILYSVPVYNKTTMIVKKIPKLKRRPVLVTVDRKIAKTTDVNKGDLTEGQMYAMNENMANYTTVLLNDTNIEDQKICHGTFCCTFTVIFTPIENADYHYRMIVYDGPRIKPLSENESRNIQVCGLAACSTTSSDSCGVRNGNTKNPLVFKEISVTGTFSKDAVIPTNTHYDLSMFNPSDIEYLVTGSGKDKIILLKTIENVEQVLGFGIYS